MDSHHQNKLFQKGLDAFNTACFYEAHEDWEEVWLDTPRPEKIFLQGLIQVAAAFHHYSRSNRQGTHKLLREGMHKLEPFPDVHRGVELERLRISVRQWLKELGAGRNPEQHEIPRIERHGEVREARAKK